MTQTGQPGPDNSEIVRGNIDRMPLRKNGDRVRTADLHQTYIAFAGRSDRFINFLAIAESLYSSRCLMVILWSVIVRRLKIEDC